MQRQGGWSGPEQTGDGPHLYMWRGLSNRKEGRHLEKDRACGTTEMSRHRAGRRGRDISATRLQWRGPEDRARRLGTDCFSEAASTGAQEDGIWRRTVPVARLQCRQWRRAATAKETASCRGVCRDEGSRSSKGIREDASKTARRCHGGCKWCS